MLFPMRNYYSVPNGIFESPIKAEISWKEASVQFLPAFSKQQEPSSGKPQKTTSFKMVSIRLVLSIFFVVAILGFTVAAGYKKPPFNGSIFGKRSNTESDAEVANRALSAMCEIASEACNAWLSR
ncbi:hypothetical protein M0802_004455 [Mischocyttarus mexicanus]|nr:hypothetical protein M0802_004455 [Mischocyttarus mexicanus]